MLHVIVNPIAGNGLALSVGKQLEQELRSRGVEFVMRKTERAGHATELAKEAAREKAESVVSVGGDGTAIEIAVGLMHTGTALGIIPAGTGNDFIKALGTPSKWHKALEFILDNQPRPVDTGIINDTYFLNVCGTGFDVEVLEYALKAKKYCRGILPYFYGVIRAIFSFDPQMMRIELDDGTVLEGKYMICSIANGRFIGGGIPIAPVADVSDGLFDIIVVENVPRRRIPLYIPALMSGRLLEKPVAKQYRCKSCTLTSSSMLMNLDGEIIPMSKAAFTCQKDALMVHW